MGTYTAKKNEVNRKWFVVDLNGKPLGRAAGRVSAILQGKNKPQFTHHVDTGDFVVAINACKVKLTGKKIEQKKYYQHTGYPGRLNEYTAEELLKKKPEYLIQHAVKGMLPKSMLGRQQLKKLKVYAGAEHPHSAQKPEEITL